VSVAITVKNFQRLDNYLEFVADFGGQSSISGMSKKELLPEYLSWAFDMPLEVVLNRKCQSFYLSASNAASQGIYDF
jgi:hypothetical protein